MKALISTISIFLCLSISGQNLQFKSDFSSTIMDSKVFEENVLVYAAYKGNASLGSKKIASSKNQFCLALLDQSGQCAWIHNTTRKHVLDFKAINGVVYYLDRERIRSGNSESYILYLNSLDKTGKLADSKVISKLKGEKYRLMVEAKFSANNDILVCHSWRKQKSANVNGKLVSNQYFGVEYYTMTDLKGEEKWSYKIEGGSDSFTETNNEYMIAGKNATYLVTAFGNVIESGGKKFTSKLMTSKNDPMPLYEDKSIITKIDNTGELIEVKELSANQFEVRSAAILDNGSLIIGGDFIGNDSDFIKQAIIMKEKMPATQISPWDQQPSNDGYVAAIDTNLNIQWIKTFANPTYSLVTKIGSFKNKIVATCEYMSEVNFNGGEKNIQGYQQNATKYDSYLTEMDDSGRLLNDYNFTGSKNTKIKALSSKNMIFYGSFESDLKTINGTQLKNSAPYNNGLIMFNKSN